MGIQSQPACQHPIEPNLTKTAADPCHANKLSRPAAAVPIMQVHRECHTRKAICCSMGKSSEPVNHKTVQTYGSAPSLFAKEKPQPQLQVQSAVGKPVRNRSRVSQGTDSLEQQLHLQQPPQPQNAGSMHCIQQSAWQPCILGGVEWAFRGVCLPSSRNPYALCGTRLRGRCKYHSGDSGSKLSPTQPRAEMKWFARGLAPASCTQQHCALFRGCESRGKISLWWR